jgi:2-methylisocitrate lyase-like PEP mutase family enzyme
MDLPAKKALLRALHDEHRPLILPNAWDAASARVLVDAGFAAIATASHAVSASLGYGDAGADGIFTIMVSEKATIAALAERIPAPLNVLYLPGMPSLARLGALGVRRVTFGPGLHRATLGLLARLAERLQAGETPEL